MGSTEGALFTVDGVQVHVHAGIGPESYSVHQYRSYFKNWSCEEKIRTETVKVTL